MLEFSYQDAERIIDNLEKKDYLFPHFRLSKHNDKLILLGEGGFSYVFEMENNVRPELKFALKVIGLKKHIVDSEEFWNTVEIQKMLSSESNNIVRVIDARELILTINESGSVTDVADAVRGGNEKGFRLQLELSEEMKRIIEQDRFNNVSLLRSELKDESEILKLAAEIGEILKVAHQQSVLHRDVKLENIYWDEKKQIYKLGDFGISKFAESGNAETIVYTDGYGAPEIEKRLGDTYNETADIYSFGITLYLLFNSLKFPGSYGYHPQADLQYNPDFIFPAPENASVRITKVIRKMCMYYPEDRYSSVEEVLADLNEEESYETVYPSDNDDYETVTIREKENSKKNQYDFLVNPQTRWQRITAQQIDEEILKEENIWFVIKLTAIMVPMLIGIQGREGFIANWLFLLMPIIAFFDVLFQKVVGNNGLVELATLGLIGVSAYNSGITIVHVLLALTVVLGNSVIIFASVVSLVIYFVIVITVKLPLLDLVYERDIGWLFLLFLSWLLIDGLPDAWYTDNMYDNTSKLEDKIERIFRLLLPIAGIVIFVLHRRFGVELPRFLLRMHLLRIAAISWGIGIIFLLYEKMSAEDISKNEDEISENDSKLDK